VATTLLEAGLPVLVEKPLADSVAGAAALVRTVARTGLPLLLGHHRRHNPIIRAAKAAIAEGRIGALVTAVVNSVLTKPDSYFNVAWRHTAGQGGPLAINMSHEIDLLRHFFGEVAEVRAVASGARRGFAVEDTAAAILTFAAGGIATITVTDAGCGPWAWDISAGENPARFPAHDVIAHAYAGTRAALSLPDLALWAHPDTPDWTVEMRREVLPAERADPYERQLLHFAAMIWDGMPPLVSAEDGLRSMMVLGAVRRSAATGRAVALSEVAPAGADGEAAP
jgi:predicted dehydrogenase